MTSTSDRKNYYDTIAKTCYTANIAYLIIHIFYLVLFIIAKFSILIYIDIAAIAIYLAFFILLKFKKYYLYALLCGNEFFAFIAITTVMLGFATGFHFYLIGLCVVSFFTSYFSKSRDIKGSLVWVGLSLVIYLTLYFVTKFNEPYYVVADWLEITLFATHAILVFVFIAAYLLVFLKYAFSLESKIMNESRTDELTQINNRYGLFDYYDLLKDKQNKALALFDIDDFKVINDKYGHTAGDYILRKVADMTTSILKDDFVCRFGGEEFVVVLGKKENESYFDKLDSLRKSIEEEAFEFEGKIIKITITIGVAKCANDISLDNWVELADKKMYQGKKKGKNIVII